jgi:hypothetical protein
MKTFRMIDLLSTLGVLAMAATPLAAVTASAHAGELSPPAVSASVGHTPNSGSAAVAPTAR